ncbi:Hypothetical predicted protein, partial [Paramuricea clavata]
TPGLKDRIQPAIAEIVKAFLEEDENDIVLVGERNRMLTKAELARIIISYEEGRRLHRDGGNVGGDDGGNDRGGNGGGDGSDDGGNDGGEVGGGDDGGNYGGDGGGGDARHGGGGGGRAGGPVRRVRHLRRVVDHYGLDRNIEDVFGRGGNRIGGDNVGDGRRGDANDGGGNDGGGNDGGGAYGLWDPSDPMILIYLDGHWVLRVSEKDLEEDVLPVSPVGLMTAQQMEAYGLRDPSDPMILIYLDGHWVLRVSEKDLEKDLEEDLLPSEPCRSFDHPLTNGRCEAGKMQMHNNAQSCVASFNKRKPIGLIGYGHGDEELTTDVDKRTCHQSVEFGNYI